MAKITRIIPFSWWPANWGLSGSRREKAYAEYHYDGEDLAYQLLDIEYPSEADKSSPAYRTAKLQLDYRYHKVGEYDYGLGLIENNERLAPGERDRELAQYQHRFGKITAEELEYKLLDSIHGGVDSAEYRVEKLKLDVRFGKKTQEEVDHELLAAEYDDHDSIEYKLKQLDLEKKHGNISQDQWEKESATLIGEPWFNIIGADTRTGPNGNNLAIELDWNEHFPRFLEQQGWTGHTDDEIVDRWFDEAMRQMVDPGLTEDQLDAMEDDDYLPSRQSSRRRAGDDGMTEYS